MQVHRRAGAMLVGAVMAAGLAVSASAEPPTQETCVSLNSPADVARCQQAISAETDNGREASLLQRRAYAQNEGQRYEEALADLNSALSLTPRNAVALHERAYTLNSLGAIETIAQLRASEASALPTRSRET